ncbi:MAG: glycoside hydrolase family 28 protein [Mucilaginibacter sp.]
MKISLITIALTGIFSLSASHKALAQGKDENKVDFYLQHAPFKMPAITEPHFHDDRVFVITDYGAVADGQTLNTAAFEKAINECSLAGGGIVLIPPGLWLTGPIVLQSNVNLHASRGALIIFTTDHSQYAGAGGKTRMLLSGNRLNNVGITGEGIYDGGGDTWRPLKKSKAAPTLWDEQIKKGGTVSADGSMYMPTDERSRPTMVSVQNSTNVLIDGPTFKNSPQFALNPRNCTNMIIRNVTINNEYYAQNGDGIDLSSCVNAVVYRCTVNAGDDGICMKSSGGQDDGVAALRNIVVADCIVYHAHGGFVIGSNTDGGMQNIYVTNCNFVNTDVGIRIKSARGRGGLVHDVYADHIYMHDILNEAILFDTYYEGDSKPKNTAPVAVTNKTPRFQDFHISNIYCNNAKAAIAITGLPEMPVNHIYFSDMVISAGKAFSAVDAAGIYLKNVSLLSPSPVWATLNNATDIIFDHIVFNKGTSTFIAAGGERTKGIVVKNTNITEISNPIELDKPVDKNAVTIQSSGK